MDWIYSLKKTIAYLEKHLLNDLSLEVIAKEVNMSPFYLEKGFQILTGYSIMEYVRNRRLYLAGLDLIDSKEKIIDIGYKYGYQTPDSFTKAFSRFHGSTPSLVRKNKGPIRTYLPLTISIEIRGGTKMNYSIETMKSFKIIGYGRKFSYEDAYKQIPQFWDEIMEHKMKNVCQNNKATTQEEKVIEECGIGEFGICLDNDDHGQFLYVIAGRYHGGIVPEGMMVYEFPELTWAKFKSVGPSPSAIQEVNTKVFKEWLPGNPDYDISFDADIEWYSQGDVTSKNYESELWLPVRRK
jgi:predicted transcriptional regulator YdeE/AraC-like DNA-binding protein